MGMLVLQLATAFLLDLVVGDPRFFPHPVRLIGALAAKTEHVLRGFSFLSLRVAGVLAVLVVAGCTLTAGMLILYLCSLVHPLLEWSAGTLILYFCIAAGDLAVHAKAVAVPLERGDLVEARRMVGRIVGRDTGAMTSGDVSQAAVESVAENTVDGVTAPLFYALLFGPLGALLYKAVNTLDSTFGYRNERYVEFGWASARIDDLFNVLPSRLTVPFVALASAILRLRTGEVFRSVRLTAHLHASPNAGYPEAAFAGALGVRFGGPRTYGGVEHNLPYLGTGSSACSAGTIGTAVRLMVSVSALFLLCGLGVRLFFQFLLSSPLI
ncbi:adenosylcobinamide-phosphate synthase CbiB [Prosthecochloris sp. HL-130-GSB]|jgi:adenosylcobinamide-phosphate synthase|uniref:adenosylcobinamide-phosphate synthase CbiB n=1 Tax=Prosthecochloris sp. HL-130-GSB TaxID=1974213 RepID=UPI001E53EFD5|nr:adenosylcobinamide-phosphate synthase CbiB [Prosthecochloris sp. HL-130-GSB]